MFRGLGCQLCPVAFCPPIAFSHTFKRLQAWTVSFAFGASYHQRACKAWCGTVDRSASTALPGGGFFVTRQTVPSCRVPAQRMDGQLNGIGTQYLSSLSTLAARSLSEDLPLPQSKFILALHRIDRLINMALLREMICHDSNQHDVRPVLELS